MKMNHRLRTIAGGAFIAAGLGIAVVSASTAAMEHPGKTLYSFTGAPDGAYPNGDLIVDAMGVYYGTTSLGGIITADCPEGCGTVYKLVNGEESVIYRFTGISDGAVPYDGLLQDAEGNLFGVTRVGGDSNMGTVFKVSPDGSKTTLHSFAGGTDDGANPNGDLIADAEGNLYGTTYTGGLGDCDGGCGTVFKVTPDGQESILHAFIGSTGPDGKNPFGGLIADEEGNFYGTTYGGGGRVHCGPDGCGTLFKITPDGQLTLIHRFEGGYTSAGHPRDRLLRDTQGNFYGTTYNGGIRRFGCVWKVSPDGVTETILYSFHHHKDGEGVGAGLVADSEWNLYGATLAGGENLAGIVYRVSPDGRIASLYDFPDATTSAQDVPGRMIIDRHGNLIGATNYGGASDNCSPFGCGTIFIVKN
jgi:uncharacterized repeat protein (TIGR03803 family)